MKCLPISNKPPLYIISNPFYRNGLDLNAIVALVSNVKYTIYRYFYLTYFIFFVELLGHTWDYIIFTLLPIHVLVKLPSYTNFLFRDTIVEFWLKTPETSPYFPFKPQRHHSIYSQSRPNQQFKTLSWLTAPINNSRPKDSIVSTQAKRHHAISHENQRHHPIAHPKLKDITLFYIWFWILCVRIQNHISNVHDRPPCKAFIQGRIKENTKAPCHWPLWGEFTGDVIMIHHDRSTTIVKLLWRTM